MQSDRGQKGEEVVTQHSRRHLRPERKGRVKKISLSNLLTYGTHFSPRSSCPPLTFSPEAVIVTLRRTPLRGSGPQCRLRLPLFSQALIIFAYILKDEKEEEKKLISASCFVFHVKHNKSFP